MPAFGLGDRVPIYDPATVFIAPNAMKDYRNAQDGQRARADRKLFAHVHSNLKRLRGDEPESCGDEVRIVVASVDILSR